MSSVRSADGTAIAYDKIGVGPPVILVGGAFSYRKYPRSVELAELLAEQFTVFNFDRRGRGDSGDTVPYSVEREIDDLAALIEVAGTSACVWGQSSGAVLALRAAAAGLAIEKLAIFEPPFRLDAHDDPPPADFATRLEQLVAADRRNQAVRYFMTKGMGAPGFFISLMRLSPRMWSRLTAVAHTLPYDVAVMGDTTEGKPLSPSDWESVRAETLVLSGAKSPARAGKAGRALADVLPNARHEALAGQSYNIKMKPLAPVLKEFFSTTGQAGGLIPITSAPAAERAR
jgi:pimeloyl-ACP methyl ester carboxylesterase